jgi:hypothetical protein
LLPTGGHPADGITLQDTVREHVATALKKDFPQTTADVLFTRESKWVGQFIADNAMK